MYVNNGLEIQHHGVKGQKWGVRRYQNKDGSLIKTHGQKNGKKSLNPFIKKKKVVKRVVQSEPKKEPKSVKDMSNDELRKFIERRSLETQYNSIMSNNKRTNRGKKMVSDILEGAAKDVGTQLVKYALASAINGAAGKKIISTKGEKKK